MQGLILASYMNASERYKNALSELHVEKHLPILHQTSMIHYNRPRQMATVETHIIDLYRVIVIDMFQAIGLGLG